MILWNCLLRRLAQFLILFVVGVTGHKKYVFTHLCLDHLLKINQQVLSTNKRKRYWRRGIEWSTHFFQLLFSLSFSFVWRTNFFVLYLQFFVWRTNFFVLCNVSKINNNINIKFKIPKKKKKLKNVYLVFICLYNTNTNKKIFISIPICYRFINGIV